MAKKQEVLFEGIEQASIRTIENQADNVKEDLANAAAAKDDLKIHRAKIAELMHANESAVAKGKDGMLVYKRGEYDVRVSRKESVSVKIADMVKKA